MQIWVIDRLVDCSPLVNIAGFLQFPPESSRWRIPANTLCSQEIRRLVERSVTVKIRWMMILLLVLLLTLTGCDTPANDNDISTSVAATLVSMDETETVGPVDPIPPTATPDVIEVPTLTPPTETPTPITDEEAIKAAMNEYLDSPVDESTIIVSEISGDLARGGLQGAYFIAAKDGGTWIIVYAGQATPYCNLVNPYGFPNEEGGTC
jgi:hypothetical protein